MPALASLTRAATRRLLVLLVLQIQPVPTHAPGIVVERNMPGADAVRHEVPPDPALDAPAGSVNGGILEAASAVAGPVVGGLRRQRHQLLVRRRLGELDEVWRGELEVGRWLRTSIGAERVRGLRAALGI